MAAGRLKIDIRRKRILELLAQNGQVCFIKPTNYDQKKTKKFKRQIGRIENMAYCHDDDCFICTQGRKLKLRREMTEQRNGQFVTTAWYRCEDCAGCPCRCLLYTSYAGDE